MLRGGFRRRALGLDRASPISYRRPPKAASEARICQGGCGGHIRETNAWAAAGRLFPVWRSEAWWVRKAHWQRGNLRYRSLSIRRELPARREKSWGSTWHFFENGVG